jgi:hypothetical protein
MSKRSRTLTATQARQGSPRRMNLRVLGGSLVLALLVGLAFYVTYVPVSQTAAPVPQTGDPK